MWIVNGWANPKGSKRMSWWEKKHSFFPGTLRRKERAKNHDDDSILRIKCWTIHSFAQNFLFFLDDLLTANVFTKTWVRMRRYFFFSARLSFKRMELMWNNANKPYVIYNFFRKAAPRHFFVLSFLFISFFQLLFPRLNIESCLQHFDEKCIYARIDAAGKYIMYLRKQR